MSLMMQVDYFRVGATQYFVPISVKIPVNPYLEFHAAFSLLAYGAFVLAGLGVRRVELGAGEKQTVTFTLRPADLAVLDDRWRPVVEPGTFRVWIGPSSAAGVEGAFEVAAK
jgi:hypothetical protein